MPKRTNDFQRLVTLINKCVCSPATVEESALLFGKSSKTMREVDILITHKIGDHPIKIGIEVVDRGRKSDLNWVGAMIEKHAELDTNKLVLVSYAGFTKPALRMAEDKRVETMTFDEAFETDWEHARRMPKDGYFSLYTFKFVFQAIYKYPDGTKPLTWGDSDTIVHLPYRDEPTTLGQMADFIIHHPEISAPIMDEVDKSEERQFYLNYTPQPGFYVIDPDGMRLPLVNFTLEVEVTRTKAPMEFKTGRLGKREVVTGSSTDPEIPMHMAWVRREDGKLEAKLSYNSVIRPFSHSG